MKNIEPGDRTSQRNYILLMAEAVLFSTGLVFFDTSTIIPLLVNRLTGSSVLIGFVGMAPMLGLSVASLFAGNWVRTLALKKSFIIRIAAVGRMPLWILGLCLFLVPPVSPLFWGIIIIGVLLTFWMADGAVSTAWMDVIGKSLAPYGRGRFFGIIQIITGILSFGAGFIISRILIWENLSFPADYGLIIMLGAFVYTLTLWAFWKISEKPSSTSRSERLRKFLVHIPGYLRSSRPFFLATMGMIFICMTEIGFPFYIVYGQARLGIIEADVGLLIAARVLGRMVGGFFLGFLGDRLGHEKAILGIALSTLLMPTLALLAGFLPGRYTLVCYAVLFVFLGSYMAGWASFMNYMLDVVPEQDRSLFAALLNLMRAPASVAPVVGGIIVRYWDYVVIFYVALLLAAIGIGISVALPASQRIKRGPDSPSTTMII